MVGFQYNTSKAYLSARDGQADIFPGQSPIPYPTHPSLSLTHTHTHTHILFQPCRNTVKEYSYWSKGRFQFLFKQIPFWSWRTSASVCMCDLLWWIVLRCGCQLLCLESLGQNNGGSRVKSGGFSVYLIRGEFCNLLRWQLQIYSHSTECAISNISLRCLSSPFNTAPSIVLRCQACQHADLLLFCLIHCNDSVYKESEEPPTYTMLIFILCAMRSDGGVD